MWPDTPLVLSLYGAIGSALTYVRDVGSDPTRGTECESIVEKYPRSLWTVSTMWLIDTCPLYGAIGNALTYVRDVRFETPLEALEKYGQCG